MTAGIDLARQALAGIPGWEGATLTPLTGGSTKRSWLAEYKDCRAILKVDAAPRSIPFRDRNEEARVQQAAAENALARRVLFSSPTVLLTEYAQGDVWTKAHLADSTNLVALARTIRRIHDLPLTGRRYDPIAAAEHYSAVIAARAAADPVAVAKHVNVVRSLPLEGELRCCHNDLVVSNIVATPTPVLIDWEYACDNNPLFDLATVVAHHRLNDNQADRLLRAWSGGEGRKFQQSMRQQMRLYEALRWLWRTARS